MVDPNIFNIISIVISSCTVSVGLFSIFFFLLFSYYCHLVIGFLVDVKAQ